MRKPVAIADRAAAATQWGLAALNMLFFAVFLLVTALATLQARAETPVCDGHDMMAELSADHPDLVAEMRKEAAETPNGKGLLWKIEKDGRPASWLFGTMHMTDPRVTKLPPKAQEAFDASDTLVIETTDVLDQAAMADVMVKHPDLVMFTDDTTLSKLLPADERDEVEKALAERGISLAAVQKMKPWMLSAMVALPACELARQGSGEPVLDTSLAAEAKKDGKQIGGLESAADQLEAMASLPLDFHLKGLVETLKLGDRIDDVTETMIGLYKKEETGMFWPFFRVAMPEEAADETGYAEFQERMITSRNRNMADSARQYLDKGDAFIAVGALHLPGEDGLIELLRRDGFTVSPAG